MPSGVKGIVSTAVGFAKCVFALVLIAFPGLAINLLEVLTLLIKPFSRNLYRRINVILVSLHWPILVWLIERWANIKIKMYGDAIPEGETALGLLNHRSDVDWIIGFAFCGRKCLLGCLKVIVKTGHKMIPIFGWMEQFVEFIFVRRNWQEDRTQLEQGLSNLIDYPKPFWFIVFPEGTRFSQAKMLENQEWARKNGKQPLSHLLWPRARAFLMTVEILGDTIESCYDATMAFDREVSFFDMLRGRGGGAVHMHVRRYPMAALRTLPPEELARWLDDRWLDKERLLETFRREGSLKMPEVPGERPMASDAYVAAWLVAMAAALFSVPWVWVRNGLIGLGAFIVVAVALLSLQLRHAPKPKPRPPTS